MEAQALSLPDFTVCFQRWQKHAYTETIAYIDECPSFQKFALVRTVGPLHAESSGRCSKAEPPEKHHYGPATQAFP